MPQNDTIFQRLAHATEGEIGALTKTFGVAKTGNRSKDFDIISAKYRSAAGNSLANAFRGDHDLPYKQILIDVADKLKPGLGWTDFKLDDSSRDNEIEDLILRFLAHMIDEQLLKMSDAEREKMAKEIDAEMQAQGAGVDDALGNAQLRAHVTNAILTGGVGALLATPAAAALFYTGFWGTLFGISTSALLLGALATALPLAILGGAWILAAPAYRQTIPATIVFIQVRKRVEAERALGR